MFVLAHDHTRRYKCVQRGAFSCSPDNRQEAMCEVRGTWTLASDATYTCGTWNPTTRSMKCDVVLNDNCHGGTVGTPVHVGSWGLVLTNCCVFCPVTVLHSGAVSVLLGCRCKISCGRKQPGVSFPDWWLQVCCWC